MIVYKNEEKYDKLKTLTNIRAIKNVVHFVGQIFEHAYLSINRRI